MVSDSILEAAREGNIQFNDKDVIGVTEAIVARAQGNYVTVEDIAQDVKTKFDVMKSELFFLF